MHQLDYKIATLIQMDVTLNGIYIYYICEDFVQRDSINESLVQCAWKQSGPRIQSICQESDISLQYHGH